MKKTTKIFVLAGLLLATVSHARTELGNGFYLEDNRVTITCAAASNGATATHGGKTYTKRIKDDITEANTGTTCTSGITTMKTLFNGKSTFNADISHWDTSSVTTMVRMFDDATAFNQDISKWDVSKVTDMIGMFMNATDFNQNIVFWDTASVTDMNNMFDGATSFNQDLSSWCVEKFAGKPS